MHSVLICSRFLQFARQLATPHTGPQAEFHCCNVVLRPRVSGISGSTLIIPNGELFIRAVVEPESRSQYLTPPLARVQLGVTRRDRPASVGTLGLAQRPVPGLRGIGRPATGPALEPVQGRYEVGHKQGNIERLEGTPTKPPKCQ